MKKKDLVFVGVSAILTPPAVCLFTYFIGFIVRPAFWRLIDWFLIQVNRGG